MIVADANLIAHLVLPSDETERARRVLRHDREWAAPLLWRSELRSVVVQRVRAGSLDASLASRVLDEAALLVAAREFAPPSDLVLRLALESGCSAYDCEYVALADELDVPLVTFDGRVLEAFPDRAAHPAAFAG